MSIRDKIREFVLTECLPGESPENLLDDAPLRSSGILDSVALLRLVSVIEESAGVEIAAHEVDAENFSTVNSILALISRKTGKP